MGEVVWCGMNDMVIKFYCGRTIPLMWPVINVWQVTSVTPRRVNCERERMGGQDV